MTQATATIATAHGTPSPPVARQSKDASQARRLLALAVIYDGGARSEAARLGEVTLTAFAPQPVSRKPT